MKQGVFCAAVLAAATANGAAHAAEPVKNFPSKPVRIIVGYTPGGGVDMAARLVGQALGELWNGTVVIDNRPGAAGGIGTEMTARAAPDGYTMNQCRSAQSAGERSAETTPRRSGHRRAIVNAGGTGRARAPGNRKMDQGGEGSEPWRHGIKR